MNFPGWYHFTRVVTACCWGISLLRRTLLGEDSWKHVLGFPWTPFPFADFALPLLAVRNTSREYLHPEPCEPSQPITEQRGVGGGLGFLLAQE